MQISAGAWAKYTERMERIDANAARLLKAWMRSHEYSSPEGVKALINQASKLNLKFGQAAAELACQMYDATAALYGAAVPAAEAAEAASYAQVSSAIRRALAISSNEEVAGSALGALVKQAGLRTTVQNAKRDGAEWAWIPDGGACGFCLMLASRGWQKTGSGNTGVAHAHSHCRCQYAVRFSPFGGVGGYSPEAYRSQWEDADGVAWEDKVNALRREQYEENADKINAQKRAAYAKRREAEEGRQGRSSDSD